MTKEYSEMVFIPDKIKQNAQSIPDQTAIIAKDRILTYRNLDELSDKAAYGILSKCGEMEEGTPIGLLLDRKSYVFPLELGIVRAGFAYIPMTDEYPEERIAYCLKNAGAGVFITTKEILDRKDELKDMDFQVLFVEEILSYEGEPKELPKIKGDRLTHIIYTSGSTGVPKGVRNTAYADAYIVNTKTGDCPIFEYYNFKKLTMAVTQISFVMSLLDYAILYNGGSVLFIPEEDYRDMEVLASKMLEYEVQSVFATPSFIKTFLDVKGTKPALAILDILFLAGEVMDESVMEPVFKINPWIHIINGFGATELNGISVCKLFTSEDRKISIGKPLPMATAYIVDSKGDNHNQLRVDENGELLVASPAVTVGYQGNNEKNKSSFTVLDGERYYKTGDIAFKDSAGEYHLVGRKDDMVKLHGQRIELGEIESVLREFEGVKQCKVLMRNNGAEDFLAAFYTAKEEYTKNTLSDFLKVKLPVYMVPSAFVYLDEMPLNANKKIDRVKLLEMPITVNRSDYVAPETELEKKICNLFETVLNMDGLGKNADFFEYGGTSLSVTKFLSKLSEEGYSVSYGDVNEHPTPGELADFIENSGDKLGIPQLDRDEYPLTKTQLGIYLEGITGGNKETYTMQYMMEAAPEIDENRIIDAVHKLFDAHPSMKYMIRCRENELPYSEFVPDAKVEVPVFEGKDEDRLTFLKSYMPVVKVLDNLLFNFAVYKSEKCCYLILRTHLIASDATSISLIISDLNRAIHGTELQKDGFLVQQAGLYEQLLLQNGAHDKAADYYKKLFAKMDGIDPLAGDLNHPLTPGVSQNYRYEPDTLKAETVKKFCLENQISEGAFFMGAMAILLGKYLYSDQVSFSMVYNGRSLSEMENTIGTLIKRIPVYGDLTGDKSVKDFLSDVSKQIFANMSNDIYSFDEVLKNCPVNEDVELIFQGDLFTDKMGKDGGEQLLKSNSYFMEHYHTGMVTGCMSIQLFSTDGFYNMTIEYRNEKFSEKWIKIFADHLFIVAKGLLECENIGDIVMMSDAEKEKISGFNETAFPIEFVPVHEQIAAYAKKSPDKKAVICNGKSLTFKELDVLSDSIGCFLSGLGVGKDVPVGVLLDRSIDVYALENGILKAGGAFVPFIPEYPDERIDFCMKDAEIPILVTSGEIKEAREGLCDNGYKVVTFEEIIEAGTGNVNKGAFTPYKSDRHDLAYCIYTSGSTGRPKGVMIEHGNIFNYCHRNEKSVEIMNYADEGRVCLALASFSFDVSVVEQFVPLTNGNTVVIATEDEIHDPELFAKLVNENGVNGITCTPTYLSSLLGIPVSRDAIKNLTFFDIGAEAFPAPLYDNLRSLRDDSVILNVYGPTECTMGCSADVVDDPANVTIGNPIANTAFYIFDKFGNELPVGLRGELIIAGDQVGRGYVNLPEKTAAAFFEHKGQKAYHSGDLCSWADNGKVRIFGRIDNQIKLRGFRIELDEIEKVMSEFAGIKAAAVRVIKTGGKEFLAGYYSCEVATGADSENGPDIDAYKEFIKGKLPEYMVPQVFRRVDDMPLTVNGKIDRKALPVPDASELQAEYVAPENEVEKKLCEAFEKALSLEAGSIGTADDFFELGGDSLKAMAVLSEVAIDGLTAADIFQKKTPKEIALVVNSRSSMGDPVEIDDKARTKTYGLSSMQIKMVDYQLYNPGSSMWSNMHILVRFGKEIDADKLCDAVNTAIRNHPGLCVVFEYNDDCELQQRYDPSIFSGVTVEHIEESDIGGLAKTLVVPFRKILKSCLFRTRVFRTGEHSYFFLDVHHLLMDGGSLGVLLQDVTDAYYGRELKRDFYFTLLENAALGREKGIYDADREYFEAQYGKNAEGFKIIVTPDHKSNKNSSAGRMVRLDFDAEQVKKAEEKWGVTHSCMAITSALVALSEHEKEDKVMCNWIYNDRLSPEAEHAVGLLIKNLPVGVDVSKYDNPSDLLFEVKRQIGEGIAHCSYDYFTGFDSAFNSDPMEVNLQLGINADELDELGPEFIELEDPYSAASARLELELLENEYGDGGFDAELEYVEEIFDKENILTFHDLYVKILESMVKA
ncbi:non-ribosomal peptide synthetase [Butyrivibrio sp. WCD2001]|uniref:non-ribosomal peptide synthetase n=1 Tax=Butyrivibrio sp. WCD2001 TaxID=1280681 RepID=UPI0004246175|nr:non-ribosomal peptide synthetase [Butyrivibrio sp. WCD2001]